MTYAAALADLDEAGGLIARARAAIAALEAPAAAPAPIAPAEAQPAPAPRAAAQAGLSNPEAFYASIRASDAVFGGTLTGDQFAGCEEDLARGAGRLPLAWMAYCLATDYHESNHTMQPIHELGGAKYLAKYDTGRLAAALGNTPEADGDGIKWAGRGKPQITGHRNYEHADRRLHELGILGAGESLLADPDLALRGDVASACLVFGMLEGWFTGKTLNHYLPARATPAQFANARRIVNGTDRAQVIAGYAAAFQTALTLGGWT